MHFSRGTDVLIMMKESTSKCTATVDLLNADRETGSWRELWAGAVAVNEICVKNGKAGMSSEGRSPLLSPCTGIIELTLSDMQVPKVDYLLNWRENSGFWILMWLIHRYARCMYSDRKWLASSFEPKSGRWLVRYTIHE